MQMHNVFHVELRDKYNPSLTLNCPVPELPGPVEVEGEDEYEVSRIVNSRTKGKGKKRKIEYFVEWEGYQGTKEGYTWQDSEDLVNTSEKVIEIHARYPKKPQSPLFRKSRTKHQ